MPRKKTKIHDEYVEIWHIEEHEPGSRLWKLILALAAEDEFNDPYANIAVTDDGNVLSTSLSYT